MSSSTEPNGTSQVTRSRSKSAPSAVASSSGVVSTYHVPPAQHACVTVPPGRCAPQKHLHATVGGVGVHERDPCRHLQRVPALLVKVGGVLVPRHRRLVDAEGVGRLAAQIPHRVARDVGVGAEELLRGADECRVRPQVLYTLGQDSRFVKQHAGARKLLLKLDQPAVEASVLVEARHLAGRVQPARDRIDEPVDRVDRASEFGLGREVWDDDKAVIEELCVLSRSQWSRRIRRAPRRRRRSSAADNRRLANKPVPGNWRKKTPSEAGGNPRERERSASTTLGRLRWRLPWRRGASSQFLRAGLFTQRFTAVHTAAPRRPQATVRCCGQSSAAGSPRTRAAHPAARARRSRGATSAGGRRRTACRAAASRRAARPSSAAPTRAGGTRRQRRDRRPPPPCGGRGVRPQPHRHGEAFCLCVDRGVDFAAPAAGLRWAALAVAACCALAALAQCYLCCCRADEGGSDGDGESAPVFVEVPPHKQASEFWG